MYESKERRNADIEESAGYPPSVLRLDLVDTADTMAHDLALLEGQAWQAQVRNAQGKMIPALELPWMRVREMWLHAVDLGFGGRMADFPAELLDVLLDDVSEGMSAKDGCPSAVLSASDRDRSWQLGSGESLRLTGTAADLAGWLSGRADGAALSVEGGALPELPAWL
jgi:maleylpyruvate isomerase